METKNYDVFSGITASEADGELQDFIWLDNNEPHASRRKEMIKKYPEVKEIMGHEPKTKYIVLALMGVQMTIAFSLSEEDTTFPFSLKFWGLAYIVGATITQAIFLAIHEISHNLAFKKFSHNKLFGIFANMPMLVPFFMYFKYYHNEHHKFQGVDGIDTDIPTRLEAILLSNFFGKLFFLTFQILFYAIRPTIVKTPIITRYHLLNYLVQAVFISSVVYFRGMGPIYYFLASVWLSGSLHPSASHFIAEHYVFNDKGEEETFSYYGILNYLTFNVGFHNEHHDFPTVAWSKLPRLYQIGKEEYYGKLPYHASWPRVMYEFLTSKNIGLFNRIKRQDTQKLVSHPNLAGSADYTGSWLEGTQLKLD